MNEKVANDPTQSGPVMVTATQAGTYPAERRRAAGETFEIEHMGHFSKRWMAKMGGEEAARFQKDLKSRREIDHLTGERVASGGVHAALAIAIEENTKLKQTIAELRADQSGSGRVAELEDKVASLQYELELALPDQQAAEAREESGLEEGDFGEEAADEAVDEAEAPEDTDGGSEEPTRRRRRSQG